MICAKTERFISERLLSACEGGGEAIAKGEAFYRRSRFHRRSQNEKSDDIKAEDGQESTMNGELPAKKAKTEEDGCESR